LNFLPHQKLEWCSYGVLDHAKRPN
jgi:hypothetical protein